MRKLKYISYVFMMSVFLSCSDKESPSREVEDDGVSGQEEYEYSQGFEPLEDSSSDPSEDTMLVAGVVVPRAFAPCLHSDDLKIRMHGFTGECKLVFASADNTEYEATIVSHDENEVVFNLPYEVVSGDWRIYVVCGQARQCLGEKYIMCDTPETMSGVNVKGVVTVSDVRTSHIVVSDGYDFTVSDEKGEYFLISDKANGYVFAQTPADAVAVTVENPIPMFFGYLTEDKSTLERVDIKFEGCDNDNHRFLLVTDMHLQYQDNVAELCTERFMPDLNNTIEQTDVPCYIFTAGDQTSEGIWSDFDLNDWKQYVSDWKCPVYHCMGNHDNDPSYVADDFMSESTFKRIIGPTWYSLDIGKVHYVVLDDIVYDNSSATKERGYFVRVSSDQLEYLRRDLLKVDPETPVVIISHSPLYLTNALNSVTPRFESYDDIRNLLDCFAGFHEVHILNGHTHINNNVTVAPGVYEHNIGASSASCWWCETKAGSSLHVCRDGTIGGYQIWDAAGRELKWRHKSMGRTGADGQFRCVDLNMVPEDIMGAQTANSVLINVYNWDENWTLNVSENGVPLVVTRIYGIDPVYKLVFPEPINSQTSPYRNDHLFMVTAHSPSTVLDIKVTDRFGDSWTKKMIRPFDFKLENYE